MKNVKNVMPPGGGAGWLTL